MKIINQIENSIIMDRQAVMTNLQDSAMPYMVNHPTALYLIHYTLPFPMEDLDHASPIVF